MKKNSVNFPTVLFCSIVPFARRRYRDFQRALRAEILNKSDGCSRLTMRNILPFG